MEDLKKFKDKVKGLEREKGVEQAKHDVRLFFKDTKKMALFAYFFLPHWFTREFKDIHYRHLDFLRIGEKGKNKATMAYRGEGKTTIEIVLAGVYEACYSTYRYVVLNSYDDTMSIDKLRLLKEEFENNEIIRYVFGEPIQDRENWNKTDIKVFGKVRIRALSTGQNPRGLLDSGTRPDKIISDDILKDEQVRSEEQRTKGLDWYKKALLPAMSNNGVAWILNTPMHPDDVISTIFKKEAPFQNWDTLKLQALENGESVDPDWKTTEELLELAKDEYTFASEYMCEPVLISSGIVKFEDLRFYEDTPKIGGVETIRDVYIHCDTTHTGKQTSDFFCIGAIGECSQSKNYYLTDFVLKKSDVAEQARCLINFYLKQKHFFNVKKITYDEKANQGFGYWVKKLAREEYNLSLPLEELQYPSDKVSHFTPHLPHFKANRLYFPENHENKKQALDQLLGFPSKGVHDDFVDMLSGCLDNFQKQKSVGLEYLSI